MAQPSGLLCTNRQPHIGWELIPTRFIMPFGSELGHFHPSASCFPSLIISHLMQIPVGFLSLLHCLMPKSENLAVRARVAISG